MNGSAKQIEWAESIQAKWISQINDVINEASRRVNDGSMPKNWLEIVKKHANIATNKVESAKSASSVINQRLISMGDLVMGASIKAYKA